MSAIYGNTVNNYNKIDAFLTDLSKKNAKIAKNNFNAYLNRAFFDKTGYNDFERNDNDTYTFTVTDPSFQVSQFRNLWLRKQKILGDDWKVALKKPSR